MRSSSSTLTSSAGLRDQRGIGLVEVLVASALLGVGMVVMLGSMSTLVVGARVADRRVAEERLVRNGIEQLMASAALCVPSTPIPTTETVNPKLPTRYTVRTVTSCPIVGNSHYSEYTVTATDTSGGKVSLTSGAFVP
jgi:Tfp pilus assembly protein PilV